MWRASITDGGGPASGEISSCAARARKTSSSLTSLQPRPSPRKEMTASPYPCCCMKRHLHARRTHVSGKAGPLPPGKAYIRAVDVITTPMRDPNVSLHTSPDDLEHRPLPWWRRRGPWRITVSTIVKMFKKLSWTPTKAWALARCACPRPTCTPVGVWWTLPGQPHPALWQRRR